MESTTSTTAEMVMAESTVAVSKGADSMAVAEMTTAWQRKATDLHGASARVSYYASTNGASTRGGSRGQAATRTERNAICRSSAGSCCSCCIMLCSLSLRVFAQIRKLKDVLEVNHPASAVRGGGQRARSQRGHAAGAL